MRVNRLVGLAALVAGLVGTAAHAVAQVDPTGSWQSRTSSSSAMYYGGGATNGTYCYYVNYAGQTERYDPSTNTWLIRATHTTGYYRAVAWANGLLWSLGTSYNYGYIYSFSDTSNTWATVATNLSRHAFGGVAAAIGNDIYVFGGYDSSSGYATNVTRVNVSNPSAPSQTNLTNHPGTTFYYYGACVAYEPFSGLIYFLRDTSLYSFNPSGSGAWSAALATCPANHAQYQGYTGTMWSGKGRLYVTGGPAGTRTDEYFPGSNQWIQRATAPVTHTYYGPASAMIGSTTAYCWGGSNASTSCSQFTLPNYGIDPNDATAVQQSGSTGVMPQNDPNLSWTNTYATFSADITDPDAGQEVALEVQVKRASSTWATPLVTASSGMGPQGVRSVTVDLSAFGTDEFDWRYHAVDNYYNFNPNNSGAPSWHEFMKNGVSPDFYTDQQSPTVPVPVYPISQDVLGPSTVSNDVTFVWNASTDNAPESALRYRIEVAHNDPSFGSPVALAGGLVPTQHTFHLTASRYNYYWHVGAVDIGGNFSGWSAPEWFRVVGDDGLNHSAGDASRILGCSAGAAAGAWAAMAGLAIAAFGLARWVLRR